MKTKAYKKSIQREIISSKARFFSILVIILLGVSFFSGIKSAGPDMNKAINHFYSSQNLMDSKIVSSLGLSDKDIEMLVADENILDFEGTHTIDANLTNTNNLVRFMEYNNQSNLNKLVVVDGRLPENPGEIALDERALKLNSNLKIGDDYIIESDQETMNNFKELEFEIVGIVKSPMYIEKESRGITPVGKGTIDYFAVVNSTDLAMDAYTEIYVRFKNVQGLDAYSDEYRELMEENTKYLEALYSTRSVERMEEVKATIQMGLSGAEKEAVNGLLTNLGEAQYYFFDRTDNQGYLGYKDSIHSLDNIASVLPVFFFLVAILICLTTMTRMVEENRIEIGTLKALGYNDLEISWKYIIYAALASISGSILGILIGSNILPMIINSAYSSIYSLPKLIIAYYPSYIIQSMAISILCTVGAALFVIRVELRSKPSQLMKAKAPKLGKKIFLERMTPFWKRLSFNHKVTLRNIFRYKQRMLMTVLGIAGCMALLVTGFGLKDSNAGLADKQFNKIWLHEAMVIFDTNAPEEEYRHYDDVLKQMPEYQNSLNIHQQAVTFSKEGMNKQSATVYVTQDKEQIGDFIVLNDRVSGEVYQIQDDGAVISEKLAKLLGVSVGDTLTMQDEANNSYSIKVSNIAENYVMHYLYMSPAYYEEVFGKQPVYNTQLLNLDKKQGNSDELSAKLLECDNVINVTLTSQIQKTTEESNESMNLVMLVIIVAAGCLAFVVLYNLNNINVSERIRELSTIKVLGFWDNEVTMYILRENVILTIMGVAVGALLGKILHAFIIHTAETDTIMMYPNISLASYVFSAFITIFFSLVVMILMHIKLKKVNMIDALKSNE